MTKKGKETSNKKVRSNANIWNLSDERSMADKAVKNLIKAEEELKVLLEAKQENGITQELINELKEHSIYKNYAEKERNKARKGFGLDEEETDNLTCDLLNKIKISEDNKE